MYLLYMSLGMNEWIMKGTHSNYLFKKKRIIKSPFIVIKTSFAIIEIKQNKNTHYQSIIPQSTIKPRSGVIFVCSSNHKKIFAQNIKYYDTFVDLFTIWRKKSGILLIAAISNWTKYSSYVYSQVHVINIQLAEISKKGLVG